MRRKARILDYQNAQTAAGAPFIEIAQVMLLLGAAVAVVGSVAVVIVNALTVGK